MTIESCRFLVEARQSGVPLGRVLTLGRQSLWVSPDRLVALLAEAGLLPDASVRGQVLTALTPGPGRFEGFLRALGAHSVAACDASGYEGAELIHDLNQPVPAGWDQQYDLILDGGTLEHVFNFPVAIANCMRMLRAGGRLILFTPANNYFGHGFYQFSPELFYRVLAPANGFAVERLQAMVDTAGFSRVFGVKYAFPVTGRRYDVADPETVKDRVLLVNPEPVLLFVQARRLEVVEPLRAPPQQSDYVGQWAEGASAHPLQQSRRGGAIATWLAGMLTERFCRESLPRLAWFLDPLRRRRFFRGLSFANRRNYRPARRAGEGRAPDAG
jgi:SAM-dependent methyltransferase